MTKRSPRELIVRAIGSALGVAAVVGVVLGVGALARAAEPRSLPNGTVIKKPAKTGKGRLKIDNGTDLDAAVKLVSVSTGKAALMFYVCAHNVATMEQIADGEYELVFALGRDWDARAQKFTRNATFSKFEDRLTYVTRIERRGAALYEATTVCELTLHAVVEGNAETEGISEEDFSKY